MPHLIQPELLESYKLETKFYKNHVSHVTFSTDLGGTTRKRLRQEVKWDNEREIGKGSFGHVRLQQRRSPCNDNEVTVRAVKVIDKQAMRRHKIVYRREIEAMAALDASQLEHQDLFVRFFGWFENEESICLALELFPEGDLQQYIEKQPVGEDGTQEITLQILDALTYIHAMGITHRDIKPSNIFVAASSPWRVKLGDFGIAKRIVDHDTELRTISGTSRYMAPELIEDEEDAEEAYTSKVDLWSLGCVVYYLLAGDPPPFSSAKRKRMPFPTEVLQKRFGRPCIDFLKTLLCLDVARRATSEQASKHPWPQRSRRRKSMIIAVSYRDYDKVRSLVKADLDLAQEIFLSSELIPYSTQIMACFLESGIDVNATNRNGETAVHLIADPNKIIYGFAGFVTRRNNLYFLGRSGADVNAQDNYCCTALHRAMKGRFHESALVLVEMGADLSIGIESQSTPIDFYLKADISCEFHYFPMAQEPGLKILTNGRGDTLLHKVVRDNSLDGVKLFLKCSEILQCSYVGSLRIDVLARNNDGRTALQLAVNLGHTSLVPELQAASNLRLHNLQKFSTPSCVFGG